MEWINDEKKWLEMVQDRNETVHTYNESLAKKIYKRLPNYVELFDNLLDSLDK